MDINTSEDKININHNSNNANNKFNKRRNKKRRHSNSNADSNANPENKNTNNQNQINKPAAPNQAASINSKPNRNFNPYKNFNGPKNKNEKKKDERNTAEKVSNENNYSGIERIEIEQNYQADDIGVNSTDNLNSKILETEDTGPKIEIVGIRFKPVGKIYFFSPNDIKYSANEKIIVETSRGLELGYIAIPNKNISANKVVQPLKQVLRKATDEDIERSERNKKMAKETISTANERIKFHNLDNLKMKLIEAEYTFDNSKLIYYFTADGRVDFRDLVKDLAAIFKTRIEMRQIGIRDQTKILGGLSICGRPFCCNSFLQDFAQVTIKMAKEQNMPINSAKMSGACGRLMCCLKYEHEAYEYLSKETPKVNSIVETSSGEIGVVIESSLLTGICKVKINQKKSGESDDVIKPFPKKNLKQIGFMKNEQEHLYNNQDKETEADTEESEDLKGLESLEYDI